MRIAIEVPDKCDLSCPCTTTSGPKGYYCKLLRKWVERNKIACSKLKVKEKNNGK